MSEKSTIGKNSLFSFLSIFIRLCVNILLFMLIARFYGAKIFGQFTFAHTLATIFILFADFGFDVLLTTEIARNKKETIAIFQTFFSLKFLFCVIASIGMWIIAFISDISLSTKILVLIFSFFVLLTAINNFLFALFKGYEQLNHETWVSFITNFSLLFLLGILAYFKVSIYIIAGAFVFTRALGIVLTIRILFEQIPAISFKLNYDNWARVKSQVFVFGIQLLFGNLFFQLDTLLLSFWKNDVEVGIYQSVFKLTALPLIIPDVLINALMPVLSRMNFEDQDRWKKLGFLMNKILVVASLPISLLLFVFADDIIKIIYVKSEFFPAIPILKIFALIIFIRFFVETYALMLTTSRHQKYRMMVVVLGTFINLLINAFLIPQYGAKGAAITSLVTNLIVGFGYVYWCSKINRIKLIDNRILFSISFTILITIAFLYLPFRNFWIEMPTLLLVTIIFLYSIGFSKEEKRILWAEQKIIPEFFKNRWTN